MVIRRINSFSKVWLRGILVQIDADEATIHSGIALEIGKVVFFVSAVTVVLEKSRVMEVLPLERGDFTADCFE